MKSLITFSLFWPSLLLAQGINEGSFNSPVVPKSERGDPIHDRSAVTNTHVNQPNGSYTYSGPSIDKTNRQGEAIDKQLRDSAFELAGKSAKLKEKASYYQKLGWATIGAGGSGAYFFWKARNYRKESSKTKKIAKELFSQADKINDVDDSEFNASLPEDNNSLDPATDVPEGVKDLDSLIGDDGKISDQRFSQYLEDQYGLTIEEKDGKILITENGITYDADNQPKLSPEVLALLSEEDRQKINQGIAEKKSKEQEVSKQALKPSGAKTQVTTSNNKNQMYRGFLAKQKKFKASRTPTATAAGKVVLYNGEPIGHKYDNLFDMIHRAYEKATEQGLFYPPNTRLNPDGTPRN